MPLFEVFADMSELPATRSAASNCETVDLDPNGDVALVVCEEVVKRNSSSTTKASGPPVREIKKRFVVSSYVLGLASPYFRALFSPNFAEGSSIKQGTCPDVVLQDDDVEAMEIILSILHFKVDALDKPLKKLPILAKIAKQCDKYQCVDPIRLSLFESFNTIDIAGSLSTATLTVEEVGVALGSTYILRHRAQMERFLAEALNILPLDFNTTWAKNEIAFMLPKAMIGI